MTLLVIAALVLALFYLRQDRGKGHNHYFTGLQALLKKTGIATPRLVLDLDRLDTNIQTVQRHIGDTSMVRIVAKSLPSPELLAYLQKKLGTRRLMAFHQPFVVQLLERFPDADILIGKPLPVTAARKILNTSPQVRERAGRQVRWLVDTAERLEQYLELARQENLKLDIVIEIDVGVHRGGVSDIAHLSRLLDVFTQVPDALRFGGFMGYEPHLAKIPGFLSGLRTRKRDQLLGLYKTLVELVRTEYPSLWHDNLCFNLGGSMTYQLYTSSSMAPANELAMGSCLVKPLDFDLTTLADHVPAAFIATPVLKAIDGFNIPLLETVKDKWPLLSPNLGRTYFIYGGWWKAEPASPSGLVFNKVFGHSANQESYLGSGRTGLQVDDLMFLRPKQSEAVFLQFGKLLVVRSNNIVDEWPVFEQSPSIPDLPGSPEPRRSAAGSD